MPKRIAAVVLAAGRATRFGGGKLTARIGDRALIRITIDHLAGLVDEMIVVLGDDAERVKAAAGPIDGRFVINENFAEGIGTSVAAGVNALGKEVDAAIIVLGDQPIAQTIMRALIAAYRDGAGAIVAPTYETIRGNPVLFDRSLFNELRQLTGDRGARDLIDRSPELVATIDFAFPPPLDVDTIQDYNAFRRGPG